MIDEINSHKDDRFKIIPATTPLTYISGLQSLNLNLDPSTGSLWHFDNFWLKGKRPLKVYGRGTPVDTTGIFGYYGIADRSKDLSRHGIRVPKAYIANHVRATLDSVYESLIKFGHVGEVSGNVDYIFPEEKDKQELFNYALELRSNLDDERLVKELDDWLSEEFRPFYRYWKA